jgi:Xaa-Pro aminopeptidase
MSIITFDEYKNRRKTFLKKLQPNSIAIIPSSPEYQRNWDNPFPYRQNNDFYYLTGFNEPEAVAVFFDDQFYLFNRKRDPLMEIWNGRRAGQLDAEKIYGADKAFVYESFETTLFELLKNRETLYFAFGRQMHWDRIIYKTINDLRTKVRAGVNVPSIMINPEIFLHEMRLHKSPAEIATMKKAADISVNAHLKAIQTCKPGKYEYELQAVMLEECTKNGSFSQAYYPIVGSGENSCILHYNENNRQIQNGDIVLIDAGCEYENYASDITRSFPANGKFSVEQKAIYEIVLKAQLAGIEKVKPGVSYPTIQETVIIVFTVGLIEIGLLKGNYEDLIQQKAYQPFYMHNAGHFLGLDTHDVGSYKPNNEWRKLSQGLVLTVEPGIYISSNTPNVDEKWWNIGIRIEDDILVTEKGCEVLTERLPKKIDDIEALMQK